MKLASSIVLAFSLCVDGFVIQTPNPASSTTTTLKDVSLQWGFDEKGNKREYLTGHWSKRNDGHLMQNSWAYKPWSGIWQTDHVYGEGYSDVAEAFANSPFTANAGMNAEAPPAQQAAPLPPSEPAQPMPEVAAAVPEPQMAA